MFILRLTRASERAAIHAVVRMLKRGGVVALPTETVYGLACDPRNTSAIKKIFTIKGRADDKPLQLIAGSLHQVMTLSSLNAPTKKIAARHWPGPLTLLVPLKPGKKLASKVRPKRTIGIRVTSLKFLQKLTIAFGAPIAATSANVSGKQPASSGRGVIRAFQERKERPDVLLDAGALPHREPSTVAKIADDGTVTILRPGSVKL